jgi:hypothetical protein
MAGARFVAPPRGEVTAAAAEAAGYGAGHARLARTLATTVSL